MKTNMRAVYQAVGSILACLPLLGHAANSDQLGVHAATLGLGLDVRLGMTDQIVLRLAANGGGVKNFHYFIQDEGVPMNSEYAGEWKFSNLGILADWFPWGGVTHLSAGLYYNRNQYSAHAETGGLLSSNTNYVFNGHTYNSGTSASLQPHIDFERTVAPYVGIGWSGRAKGNLSFTSDIGVLVQGAPRVSVQASGWAGGTDMNALQHDAAQSISNQITNTKLYPVVSIGFAYGF
ncbi:MAG: hypothetical protein OHK0054_12400 [Sideroxydans sp.]